MKRGRTLFITGAAGYIGAMLCDQFSKRPDVAEVIALDKEPMPALLRGNKKVTWISGNTSEPDAWRERVSKASPEVIIHAAWQIRDLYGKRKMQWYWNVDGSNAMHELALTLPTVRTYVYFSTASSYGADPKNTIAHRFTESEPFRDETYQYAVEKKRAEENLRAKYEERARAGSRLPAVFVVRPAAITGPRGRYMFRRFGLMSTLRNRLPNSPIYKMLGLMVNRIPVAGQWCRQMVHEDDVCDIVSILAFDMPAKGGYDVFNLAPPGPPVMARDMATIVNKKTIRVSPLMVRIAFFIFWHLTRGVIATSPGGWKYYCYPIVMDGSKVTRRLGHKYRFGSRDALAKQEGRYVSFIPKEERVAS